MIDAFRRELAPLVGQRILIRRNKREWSLADLAKKINVSPQTVHQIERGTMLPSWQLLYRLSDAFDVDPCDLLPTRRELEL